jgi:hypothetical protein
VKLLHSADWQLGARFRQFGARAEELRRARFAALRWALVLARERKVDAMLIAGDLFEDNEVDDAIVREAASLFVEFDDVRVFVSPGNHDPYTGPGCVWERASFRTTPVHVFREAGVVEVSGAFLLGAPLHQKKSTLDPSAKFADLARTLPAGAVKIGMTHGSPDIPGMREDNDFPIARNAATRAGLDFLGIGHWHSWLVDDGGRMLMPGTPEPDAFDRRDCGWVAIVETAPGALPLVEKIRVATLGWHAVEFDFLDAENSRRALRTVLDACIAAASVVRVSLRGSATREVLGSARQWIADALAGFPIHQVQDESSLALSEAELEFLKGKHPILTQVLADLGQLAALKLGMRVDESSSEPLSLAEADRLLAEAKIDAAQLTPAHFEQARHLLLQHLQDSR